jgi:hypothetical protein
VQGLSVGSVVKLRGVTSERSPRSASAGISTASSNPRASSYASSQAGDQPGDVSKVSTKPRHGCAAGARACPGQGITGTSILALRRRSIEAVSASRSPGRRRPVIPSAPSQFGQLLASSKRPCRTSNSSTSRGSSTSSTRRSVGRAAFHKTGRTSTSNASRTEPSELLTTRRSAIQEVEGLARDARSTFRT